MQLATSERKTDQAKDIEIQGISIKEIENEAEALGVTEPDYAALAESHRIPQGIDVPAPESVFERDGIPMMTRKSFSLVIAKAKAGKTTAVAWMVAQVLRWIRVLWIDTEQGFYYGSRTQHWVLSIAGVVTSENFSFFDFKIHPPDIRRKLTLALVSNGQYDVIVIDGIRDYVKDFNSPEESSDIVTEIMYIAEVYNCHIITILHQNKGNEHAKGHMGTEFTNKAETVLKVSQNDAKHVIIEPEFTRGKPFEPFALDRDEDGKPFLLEGWSDASGTAGKSPRIKGPSDVPPESHIQIVQETFKIEPLMLRSQLVIAAQANIKRWLDCEVFGKNKADEWIHHWEQFEYIKVTGTRGTKSAKYSINEVK